MTTTNFTSHVKLAAL